MVDDKKISARESSGGSDDDDGRVKAVAEAGIPSGLCPEWSKKTVDIDPGWLKCRSKQKYPLFRLARWDPCNTSPNRRIAQGLVTSSAMTGASRDPRVRTHAEGVSTSWWRLLCGSLQHWLYQISSPRTTTRGGLNFPVIDPLVSVASFPPSDRYCSRVQSTMSLQHTRASGCVR